MNYVFRVTFLSAPFFEKKTADNPKSATVVVVVRADHFKAIEEHKK